MDKHSAAQPQPKEIQPPIHADEHREETPSSSKNVSALGPRGIAEESLPLENT